ncbi:hypothetical protein RND71_036929 [Anisodus tanguticus]|uniref:Uncharacterized protein n=1 Tax=Anisodus tanguticus TaxID=243964 RepID=A0AAE1R1W6_9SOLA|nr:hypothetical protein RND71_036929 [Anisodus tanguticus]
MDQGNPYAPPSIPHALNRAMGDPDLALRLGPPSPTKEALERELSTFLSSFGNREVRRDVLEGTIRKLDLNNASPEKSFFFEDPTTYAGTFQRDRFFASTSKKALLKALKEWEKGDMWANQATLIDRWDRKEEPPIAFAVLLSDRYISGWARSFLREKARPCQYRTRGGLTTTSEARVSFVRCPGKRKESIREALTSPFTDTKGKRGIRPIGHALRFVVTTTKVHTGIALPYSLNPKTETLVQREARETSSVIYATIGETLATSTPNEAIKKVVGLVVPAYDSSWRFSGRKPVRR